MKPDSDHHMTKRLIGGLANGWPVYPEIRLEESANRGRGFSRQAPDLEAHFRRRDPPQRPGRLEQHPPRRHRDAEGGFFIGSWSCRNNCFARNEIRNSPFSVTPW